MKTTRESAAELWERTANAEPPMCAFCALEGTEPGGHKSPAAMRGDVQVRGTLELLGETRRWPLCRNCLEETHHFTTRRHDTDVLDRLSSMRVETVRSHGGDT